MANSVILSQTVRVWRYAKTFDPSRPWHLKRDDTLPCEM